MARGYVPASAGYNKNRIYLKKAKKNARRKLGVRA